MSRCDGAVVEPISVLDGDLAGERHVSVTRKKTNCSRACRCGELSKIKKHWRHDSARSGCASSDTWHSVVKECGFVPGVDKTTRHACRCKCSVVLRNNPCYRAALQGREPHVFTVLACSLPLTNSKSSRQCVVLTCRAVRDDSQFSCSHT